MLRQPPGSEQDRKRTARLLHLLGGKRRTTRPTLSVDASGVVTVAGVTTVHQLPVHDQRRLRHDLQRPATTLSSAAWIRARPVGVVTVAGSAISGDFPTTSGAYDTTYNGGHIPFLEGDAFVSRLSMGVAFYADHYELSLKQAGTQNLWLDAGAVHANRSYAIFGSVTGTTPGLDLLGIHIPLNVDPYTDITIASAVPPIFVKFRGTLDSKGEATASFNVPANLPVLSGFTFHHAYVVYDASGTFYMASNAVPLRLR